MTTTDADRAKAHALWNELLCNGGVPGWNALDTIAAALAAERAAVTDAVTRPLLALAEEMEAAARLPVLGEFDRGVAAHQQDAATRVRAVAAALGETGGGQ